MCDYWEDNSLGHQPTRAHKPTDNGILTVKRSSIVNNKRLVQWAHLYGFKHWIIISSLSVNQDHYNSKIYADLIESYIEGLFLEDNHMIKFSHGLKESITKWF